MKLTQCSSGGRAPLGPGGRTPPPAARAVVDSVNRALTTEKLQELNKRQELDGQDPDGLAKRFLQDAKLL